MLSNSFAQENSIFDGNIPEITVYKTNATIKLDGVLDEAVWSKCEKFYNYSQYTPTDTVPAMNKSEVFITYDDNNIYVACIAYLKEENLVIPSLRRDYSFRGSDNVTFLFDTFGDKTNAFVFGINPLGVRREALISNGGRNFRDFSFAWDNKWNGDAKIYDDKYITEIAIPFSTLRYNQDTEYWRFNTYRNDTEGNEISTWIKIPNNNILADITFMGRLYWNEGLPKPGSNISIIPFVTTAATRDFEDEHQEGTDRNFAFGGDAKVALTSSLNMDLTANPDFSQVEVDRQVTNLDRFEIFFPERRQFFIENADLFGGFGTRRINPFFSRRIGISTDTTSDETIQNTIHGGVRISGKLNDKLRVGFLNMQTASQEENDLPSFNFGVLAVEQQVFDRSNIAFALINKQAVSASDFGETNDTYNRVAALEYRLATPDNVWAGKLSFQKAFTVADEDKEYAHMAELRYNKRTFNASWFHSIIGNGFDAQVGFVPRRDILQFGPGIGFNIYPKDSEINLINLRFNYQTFYQLGDDNESILDGFQNIENSFESEFELRWNSGMELQFNSRYNQLILLEDFDPTRIQEDDVFLAAGNEYKNFLFSMEFNSDRRKDYRVRFEPLYGTFFSGKRYGFDTNLEFRVQPYLNIGLRINYNHIDINDEFEVADLWLIGPRIDVSFSKKLFLTSFIQYNNQIDNLSTNTRLQWRFAPVSDFFLVYSDNYLLEEGSQFTSRNRGIVAKFTYWLNI